jgi:hypothetical protein
LAQKVRISASTKASTTTTMIATPVRQAGRGVLRRGAGLAGEGVVPLIRYPTLSRYLEMPPLMSNVRQLNWRSDTRQEKSRPRLSNLNRRDVIC